MILEQRVLHEDNDISTNVNDFRTNHTNFTYSTGEYLYIGTIVPMNNLFFELSVVNNVAATVSIDIWYGSQWVSAVDIIDETDGLFSSGRIQWNTNILKGWDREQYSKDVTGLSATSAIYNMYWIRMSWDANLKPNMAIKYMGQKFANDAILYSRYPDLNNQTMLDSFDPSNPSGTKTNWDEQHFAVAEYMVKDLKRRGIIKSRGQILDYSMFEEAACHKVAEFIYTAFGRPYFDQMVEARSAYKEMMNAKYFNTDVNATGSLELLERKVSSAYLRR